MDNPTPMNMIEALEMMKIIVYFEEQISPQKTILEMLSDILKKCKEDNTEIVVMRMLALLYHKSIEEIGTEMHGKAGVDLLAFLSTGFSVNPLADLLQSAKLLGIRTGE